MTREEAIEKLERKLSKMKVVDSAFADCVDGEALEIAVKALKESGAHEVKHARWKESYGDFYCTNCCAILEEDMQRWHNFYYCYHCGAKMDGKEEEQ